MNEAVEREFRGARSAAYGVPRFKDANGMTCPGDLDGCRKAVRARSNDHCFKFHRFIVYVRPKPRAIAMPEIPNHARWVVIQMQDSNSQSDIMGTWRRMS